MLDKLVRPFFFVILQKAILNKLYYENTSYTTSISNSKLYQ